MNWEESLDHIPRMPLSICERLKYRRSPSLSYNSPRLNFLKSLEPYTDFSYSLLEYRKDRSIRKSE